MARDRGACRAHGRRRQAAGSPTADLSFLLAQSCNLDRAGGRHAGAPFERRRGLGACRQLGARHEGRLRAGRPFTRARSIRRSSASSNALRLARAWTRRRSCGCSRRATPIANALSPRPTNFAERRAATSSATSSTATSTIPISAPTAASSAPFPRARRMRRCAARLMTSLSMKSCGARPRRGSEAQPRSASRAASIPITPARPISRICRAIKAAVPDMHIHAFSPLEVTQGAATLGLPIRSFLARAQGRGLQHLAGHRR